MAAATSPGRDRVPEPSPGGGGGSGPAPARAQPPACPRAPPAANPTKCRGVRLPQMTPGPGDARADARCIPAPAGGERRFGGGWGVLGGARGGRTPPRPARPGLKTLNPPSRTGSCWARPATASRSGDGAIAGTDTEETDTRARARAHTPPPPPPRPPRGGRAPKPFMKMLTSSGTGRGRGGGPAPLGHLRRRGGGCRAQTGGGGGGDSGRIGRLGVVSSRAAQSPVPSRSVRRCRSAAPYSGQRLGAPPATRPPPPPRARGSLRRDFMSVLCPLPW